MTTLIIILVFVYLGAAVHTMRRLLWHFCHDKGRYDRDGGCVGAFVLAVALPLGLVLLWHMDRTLAQVGDATFMLAPRRVRQAAYIEQLERKLELR